MNDRYRQEREIYYLMQEIKDLFPEAEHELEPVRSYLEYFQQLLWRSEGKIKPATAEEIARMNPLLRAQLGSLVQSAFPPPRGMRPEYRYLSINPFVLPVLNLAGAVTNGSDFSLSAERRTVIERGLALALTLPQNQVQWKETTVEHMLRLVQRRYSQYWDEPWPFDSIKRERRCLTVYLRRGVMERPMLRPSITTQDLAVTVIRDAGWVVVPTEKFIPDFSTTFADKYLTELAQRRRQAVVTDYLSGRDGHAVYERRRAELSADGLLPYTPLSLAEIARRQAESRGEFEARQRARCYPYSI